MSNSKHISVFEYSWLIVGHEYGPDKTAFNSSHFKQLNQYLTQNPDCGYYTIFYDRVRFCNYVGAIQVGDLTIEVLPKADKHDQDEKVWQKVLIDMLAISLQVKAKTTTKADIQIRQLSVLETFLQLFLQETELLLHQGLVKKYRTIESNQTSLKGKLMIHQQVTKNLVHAERFYVRHQIYDRDNVFNRIIQETLLCIQSLQITDSTVKWSKKLLIDFPECSAQKITNKLFQNLKYDRKTQRYKTIIELARIILMNYHPDIKGGRENILAIMFDMNLLWETYIYVMLYRAKITGYSDLDVIPQENEYFWQHPDKWRFSLRPDLVVKNNETKEVIILDTKWKYKSDTSIEDVRQMYAYGDYFNAKRRYLLYPDKLPFEEPVKRRDGKFYDLQKEDFSKENLCGLMFIDLLNKDNRLNMKIGFQILNSCFENS